jgi:UDP-N-acetylglucosamine diphosphorylase/glucosamine-1-phosphate N-acetyltransferase
MAIGICFYEDDKFHQFYPLTYLRPVCTLRAGIVPLFKRIERYFSGASICLAARNQIAPLVAEKHPDFPVNLIKRGDEGVLFVNGRIRHYGDLPKQVKECKLTTVFKNDVETVAVLFQRDCVTSVPKLATPEEYVRLFQSEGEDILEFETTATLYNHSWEIMADIEAEIIADFDFLRAGIPQPAPGDIDEKAALVNQKDILLDNDVRAGPTAVIAASRGPVYIGANTRIEPQAAVYGPCYIGPNSIVVAGKISASSIGHTCRGGGEVEESIFHEYVNKYHAGFIGHSYVGPWVNFGAMTTNSDLKNNYSNIRVSLNGESIDTGSIKVGSFIGDHTKFGIGTLLNTGINIGVCCNLFGGTLIVDKEVPSFSWGNSERYETYRFEKAVETAQKSAGRRDCRLSEREITVLKAVFDDSQTSDGVLDFS